MGVGVALKDSTNELDSVRRTVVTTLNQSSARVSFLEDSNLMQNLGRFSPTGGLCSHLCVTFTESIQSQVGPTSEKLQELGSRI